MSDRETSTPDRGLLIGEAAEVVGITPKAIRLYHRLALVPEPERDDSGYRRYRPHELTALARVVRLRDLGLSLREIEPLLRADDGGTSLRQALEALDEQLVVEIAERRRRRRLLADLRRQALDDPLHASAPGPAEERLIERLRLLVPDMTPDEEAFERRLQRALAAFRAPGLDADAVERGEALADELLDVTGGAEALVDRHRRMFALADAAPDDPRVTLLAEDMRSVMRQTAETLAAAHQQPAPPAFDDAQLRRWSAAISAALDTLPPAVRHVWEIVYQELLEALGVPSSATA
jgi:DNA-binding transcriptional MerR regulator